MDKKYVHDIKLIAFEKFHQKKCHQMSPNVTKYDILYYRKTRVVKIWKKKVKI